MSISLNIDLIQQLRYSLVAAGVAGITRLTHPQATAVAYMVSEVALRCFMAIGHAMLPEVINPGLIKPPYERAIQLASLSAAIYCGTKVGQRIDPALTYATSVLMTGIIVAALIAFDPPHIT